MNNISRYYYTGTGEPRSNGIYCPVFDRFLLIDKFDFWVTLDTAKVISSKIACTVYILPETYHLDNDNCLNWSIFNKISQKRENSTDLVRGQIPQIRVHTGGLASLIDSGYPEDFKSVEGIQALKKLKNFAEVTHSYMYAAKITQAMQSSYDLKSFTNDVLYTGETANVQTYHGPQERDQPFDATIRRIFYHADTIEEAKAKTREFIYADNSHPAYKKRHKLFYEILEGRYDEF